MMVVFVCSYWIFAVWCIIGTWRSFRPKTAKLGTMDLNQITVLVPFRNEETRITPLLESCKSYLPKEVEIIFIDDHSTDQTVQIIHQTLPHARVLTNTGRGKKQAIRAGIYASKRVYILTWDADISFGKQYWKALTTLEQKDLHILPIRFKGNLLQQFCQLDTHLAQITNYAQSGWCSPIVSSGANLLFKKEAHFKWSSTAHEYLASGDDQFLLADFKKNGATIELQSSYALSVETPSERGFKALFDQRLRWLSKTPATKDKATNAIAVIQFILLMIWSILITQAILVGQMMDALYLYGIKLFIDLLICLRYFISNRMTHQLILLPLFEIYFPIYSLLLGITSLFYQPQWKGRKLKNK